MCIPPCESELSRRAAIQRALAATALLVLPRSARAEDAGPGGRGAAAEPDYVATALAAERWIARSAIVEGEKMAWPVDPAHPAGVQRDLYSGTPGVVLLYLELFHATGDRRWLEPARAGARQLVDTLHATPESLGEEGAGLYTGVAGTAYVLEMVRGVTADPTLAAARDRAVALLRSGLVSAGNGAAWNPSTDIISGSGGILLTLAWLDRHGGAWDGWKDDAVRTGDRLLEVATPEHGGLKWGIAGAVPRRYPNFSHGTAGVSYVLATLYRETGERRFLDAALAGERYLHAIATDTSNGGMKIFHSEPGGERLFYLSWCHGPAGTARLYQRLAEVTGDAVWGAMLPRLATGIVDSGVPERHPDGSGYWNNVSQCCGASGVAEFFIALHAMTGDARHLAFARRVMDDTVARATADGDGMKWIQAEHRVRPELLVAQTGLMQGAAGVGLALLHLNGALVGRRPLVALPDAPEWV